MIKFDRGPHVTQAVFGDLPVTSLFDQPVHIQAGHSVTFGRFEAKGFAVEIEVESSRGAVASADAVESQLLGEVAVRLGGITVAEPILARDGHVQDRRTQVEKGNIKATSVERDDPV